jgi:hypothetical protein
LAGPAITPDTTPVKTLAAAASQITGAIAREEKKTVGVYYKTYADNGTRGDGKRVKRRHEASGKEREATTVRRK